jgi:hypothetical protein
MIVSGKVNFSFDNFSMSECFIWSTNARLRFLSSSYEFTDDTSGQKKILSPVGKSGVNHKKSEFHKQFANEDDGWKDILSICSLCIRYSFALNWVFFLEKSLIEFCWFVCGLIKWRLC